MASNKSASDVNIGEPDALERVEEESVAVADDGGNSSEDEGELIPKVVENFYFTDENQEPVSFTVLPNDMDGNEIKDGSKRQVFLEGTADGGLQKVYKQVIAWKLSLQEQKPVVCVMIKERAWIQLQKPRKSYEEIIRSFLVSSHFLHFARRNPEALEKAYWEHLRKVFSTSDVKPSETDLLEHSSLIEAMCQGDEKLKKANVLNFFVEMKSTKRKASDEDEDFNPKAKRAKFFVGDEDSGEDLGEDGLDEFDEEEDDLFDSVCAICDNGGELLCCEGPCMRSFHPNREAGEDSSCKSLGLSKAQIKEMQNFYCLNCKYKQHQCFICGKLGSSDKSSVAEVFCCVSATCGLFYHPQCVSRMIVPEAEAEDLEKKIADGLQFTCPVHRCIVCKQTEQKEDEDMQFAICRRCPKAYHRKCLPKFITFEETDDEPQRAWEDLIPNRILIYCRKHKIDSELGTPRRNHIIFPEVPSADKIIKRNHVISPESSAGKTAGKKIMKSPDYTKEKPSPKLSVKKGKSALSGRETAHLKVRSDSELPKKVTKEIGIPSSARKGDKHSSLEIKRSLGPKQSKPKDLEPNKSIAIKGLTASKQDQKKLTSLPPAFTENDIKITIMNIVERSTSGISIDDVCAKHQVPSTHKSYIKNLDKSITQGKVEGSVEAVRTALKKLEEGGNIDDAKAVCGPDILSQMFKWKNKLKVYLAPFLHGMRYTSYGRHFTKVDKLREVVERLHWYVNSGDTIVDFCCGANDFSRLMKAKLEVAGKKCFYKNFDIIQPKDDFEFEKRDWMTVRKDELPTGTRLIMGLNPPFGVNAALANKFIDKALEFHPKLLILIVPKETKRLDEKRERYDLVWEDLDLLKGESFYMPGSVDVDDNQLGQWNLVAPPLYLWSRSDWTTVHRAIGTKQGHVKDHVITAEPAVSDTKPSLLFENNLSSGKHVKKNEQGYVIGNETIKSGAGENERESKPDFQSLVHQQDGSRKKNVPSTKIKDEEKESQCERNIAEQKIHEENSGSQKNYETQRKDKDSDIYEHGHSNLYLEQNYMSGQKREGREDEQQKHQKEESPGAKERADHMERERHNNGRYEKAKQGVDKSEKDRPERERQNKDRKRERPEKGKFEKEIIAPLPQLKKLDTRKDDDNDYKGYTQEQGSLHVNAMDGFGRSFDRGPGNRDDHARGLQIGATELGQEIGGRFQGILPGDIEETYGRGYHRMSGGGDAFSRVHRNGSEDFGQGIQLGRSGNVDEEYAPVEVNRGYFRSFPGSEPDYSATSEHQLMQNNRVYSRQAQHDYDSERLRLLPDTRPTDWLMGDSQRSRYHIEQASRVNDAYVPGVHRSLMLGQQHEEPSHLSRGMYHSETYRHSGLTKSAMERYAPHLDRSNFVGDGQPRGSLNFPFDPLAFAPGQQKPYPHQSSSGWIDE